jgi:dipeptidyl aminopeptidase/acylaminoacyl peptidase
MRRFAFFALFTLSSGALAQAPVKRPLQVADFYKMRTVGDPQRSPDGLWVAYTVSRVDSVKDRNDSDIWWTSWDGATSVRITSSDESETSPRWSPDGKQLAFLSSRQGSKGSQIWLLNRAGGEAERISEIKGGVSSIAWAPDGKRLALVVNDPDPVADSANAKPKPIVIDKYHFKEDGQGYISPQRSHIWLFDLAARKAEQITRGDADDTGPAWSPDGMQIAFTAQREPDAEKYDNSDVYVVEARTGAEPKRLTTFQGADEGPLSWNPDGSLIAYRQGPEPKNFGYGGGFGTVAVVSPNGGAPRLLATSLDRVVTGSRWTHDGRNIIGTVVDDQRQYLARIRADGSGVERVASTVPVVGGFSEGTDGGVAALGTSPSEPGEIFAIEANGTTRQLTHHNAWLSEIALASIELVVSKSDDLNEVHGILRKPAGAVVGRKLPMIVRVHGGPAGQDAFQFDFEKELLAARGWAVLAPNYRGSSGRGAAYTVAIAGDWCNKEVRDIHGMVDALVKSGVADEQHLGVGGWSYGGILTDCLVASDTRFKAATSGAGVSNVFSMYGHDQYVVQYDLELGQPWKNVEKWMKVSTAFFHADKIKTPTLFLGGALDANVPVLGGEQMYQALKSLGIETELIVYPGEYHGIRRPSFQRDRFERYVAWYSKYLTTAQ